MFLKFRTLNKQPSNFSKVATKLRGYGVHKLRTGETENTDFGYFCKLQRELEINNKMSE